MDDQGTPCDHFAQERDDHADDSRDEFARAYGMDRYATLKAKYDPRGEMLGLYEKCVLQG
ncbi:MAG: hypothetical protein H0W48_02035 [Methylibium sp.]|uniref:hypothetical protein n=1 Tax=Methylibium sp. TaxID=2067992 RepID=UPI0017C4C878|nr:hypothetical protein [Methylibium sp.]MBA2723186.1 hypothetical protein [Methylibium sp.]MBA3589878.1 hypothetical protein [Methylibium sp.]MBA3623247.1 hypothetical protein [Methylibium sp.]